MELTRTDNDPSRWCGRAGVCGIRGDEGGRVGCGCIQIFGPLIYLFIYLFCARKIGPELTAVPIFLYFVWHAATAWLVECSQVPAWDLNPGTLDYQSRACKLIHYSTWLTPGLSFNWVLIFFLSVMSSLCFLDTSPFLR